MSASLLQQLRALPPAEQEAMLQAWAKRASLTMDQLAASLIHDWTFIGRPEQQPPQGDWKFWLIMTGRRFGKTRTAAEWVHHRVKSLPKTAASTGGLLQRTSADLRDIMVEGPSGLLATAKPDLPLKYEPSKRQVTFDNGYILKCYSAEEPDSLRGPTLSSLWADEFACVVGGTLVLMADGTEKRADSVRPGDMVTTRQGPRQVLHAWLSNPSAPTLVVTTGDGHSIRTTPNHKFATLTGWVTADQLVPGSEIIAWQSGNASGVGLTSKQEEPGDTAGTPVETQPRSAGTVGRLSSVGGFSVGTGAPRSQCLHVSQGSRGTSLVQKATSIGSTSPLSRVGRVKSTSSHGLVKSGVHPNAGRGGTSVGRFGSSTVAPFHQDMKSTTSTGTTSIIALRTLLSSPSRSTDATMLDSSTRLVSVSTVTEARVAPVYDLTVEGAHEFVANGIVVHNSLKTVTGIDGLTAFDNALIALSAPVPGDRPRGVITTTPRRVSAVRKVLAEAALHPEQYFHTMGSMYDNIDNLDSQTVNDLISKHGGTALGSQELDGLLVNDVEGASFKSAIFDATRIPTLEDCPEFSRVAVAVDPSSGDGSSDECGISVVALSATQIPTMFKHKGLSVIRNMFHIYVLEDASISGPPEVWAGVVSRKAEQYLTTTVVAEGNQGGEMVKTVIRSVNPSLRVKIVHARVGKNARAEPVASLFAQGRAHLVGEQQEMEDQATTFVAGTKGAQSPDRADAMVWGVTFLEPSVTRSQITVSVSAEALAQPIGEEPGSRAGSMAAIISPDSGDYLSRQIG